MDTPSAPYGHFFYYIGKVLNGIKMGMYICKKCFEKFELEEEWPTVVAKCEACGNLNNNWKEHKIVSWTSYFNRFPQEVVIQQMNKRLTELNKTGIL